jgi:hypothetical protein
LALAQFKEVGRTHGVRRARTRALLYAAADSGATNINRKAITYAVALALCYALIALDAVVICWLITLV